MTTDNKCRIWIPAFAHLSFYLDFIRHGRDNIDIVSTVAMEELWVTLALVSASTPALMRLAKRFTTSGVTVGTTYASSRSGSRTKTKGFTHKLASFNKNKPTTSDPSYRGEACQHLDLDLVDLEVKGHFRIRKVQPEVSYPLHGRHLVQPRRSLDGKVPYSGA